MTTTNNATNNDRLTTNGQLLIGSTSASPVVSTITAGTGITITNGAGSITVASSASSSALTWLASVTASGTATITFTGKLSTTYDNYIVTIENLQPVSNSNLQCRLGYSSGTYIASGYIGSLTSQKTASGTYTVFGVASATTALDLTDSTAGSLIVGNNINGGGIVYLSSTQNATFYGTAQAYMTYYGVDSVSGNKALTSISGGLIPSPAVLTDVEFFANTGNLNAGTFKLYGIQN